MLRFYFERAHLPTNVLQLMTNISHLPASRRDATAGGRGDGEDDDFITLSRTCNHDFYLPSTSFISSSLNPYNLYTFWSISSSKFWVFSTPSDFMVRRRVTSKERELFV